MAIREIHVTGYRSVRSLRLHLSQINVLTGANATGKTNLYNSVFLLAKAAAGGFAQVIAEEGGMPSVLWAGARKSRSMGHIRMEGVRMTLGIKSDTFSYELVCGLPKQGSGEKSAFSLDPEVKEERVWMDAPHGLKVTFFERSPKGAWILDNDERLSDYSGELLPTESVLSQLREPHLYPELSSLRTEMSRWRFYHHFRTDPESPLRHPQVGVRTPVLAHDGRDLAAALQTINEVGQSQDLHEAIRQAFPGASLEIEHDEDNGMFAVLLRMPGLRRPLRARELSDGTLRYLCLLAALLSPHPPALLALNEPETSLHPDLLEPLAKQLVNAGKYSQLWVVTHSQRLAELVEKFSGEAPINLELVGGETRVLGHRAIDDSEEEAG
ncbi:MAG TPA: AAA family ATPase [Candidatus Dormibacteraeota bacterium]|nr:AAA family ATPase [Candidatus Dormibacteraeota bacterium]